MKALPDDGDAFGDVSVENKVFDGDQSMNIDLSIDERDSDQIVRFQLPQNDPLTDVGDEEAVELGHRRHGALLLLIIDRLHFGPR